MIAWDAEVNGMGSVDYWLIIEPLGTFICVFPINTDNGTMYEVQGPLIDRGTGRYSTLNRAKEVAEDLLRFQQANPIREVPIGMGAFKLECNTFIPPPL